MVENAELQCCWDEEGERKLLDPEIVEITIDHIRLIREKLKATQDRQKSYTDLKHRDVVLKVSDKMFL